MPAIPPTYTFEARNAQEIKSILDAVEKLVDAHLLMLSPGDSIVRSELRKQTPAHLKMTLDLGPILERITEVEALNAQFDSAPDSGE
jgi:hypothetical protein